MCHKRRAGARVGDTETAGKATTLVRPPEQQPQPPSGPTPEPQPSPEPAPSPSPTPEPEPTPQPPPDPAPQPPEPVPPPAPEPVPEPKPPPAPEPSPPPQPEPEPVSEPTPQSAPEPAPAPVEPERTPNSERPTAKDVRRLGKGYVPACRRGHSSYVAQQGRELASVPLVALVLPDHVYIPIQLKLTLAASYT
jgi:hypothetical protein